MYQRLLGEVSDLRQGNRRRIRKGLWALIGVTVGLLALVFISQSSKVIFLLLWIVSMFGVAAYLIGVEYMDYQMQHKVGQIANMREGELREILTLPESSPKSRLAARLRREADALEGVETPLEQEQPAPAVVDLPRSLVDLEPLEDPEPEQPDPEISAAEPQPAPETAEPENPTTESAGGSRAASYVPSRLAAEAPRARRTAQSPRTRRAPAQASPADEDYSLENILAEYGGDAPAEPQPAPQQPVQQVQQPAAPTALAPRTAPLDLSQLMQEPRRMARVAHDLSLLSQALQGLSEDLWQQGEEGRK